MATTPKNYGLDITAANTAETVGTVGASGGMYVIHICNRNASTVTVQLGINSSDNAFIDSKKILNAESLGANASVSFGPLGLNALEKIIAQSDTLDVTFLMTGVDY